MASVSPMYPEDGSGNWVALLLVVCAFAFLLLIPLRILAYGYLPPDDALRHAAKVIADKPWDQILLLRPEIRVDPHTGWHQFLTWIHGVIGGDAESLVVFSVVFLFLVYTVIPLFFARRPEAWLLSLLVVALATSTRHYRLLLGRPYILSMAVVVFLCLNWYRFRSPRSHPVTVALLTAGVAISTWSHAGWYLWALPVIGFFMARQWHAGLTVAIACAAGILLGATFTGEPIDYLAQGIRIGLWSVDADAVERQLVTEFHPSAGDWSLIVAVGLLLLWRGQRKTWKRSRIENPVFCLAILGWMLGLKTERFWIDWGIPAVSVWILWEFQDILGKRLHSMSWHRLALGAFAGVALFLAVTADHRGRWTENLTTDYLDASKADLRTWLPDPGGIFYNDNMEVFYQTFFRNPQADWRYALGFEQSLMPPEDQAVYRKVVWNHGADRAYEEWVQKLGPRDRLVLRRPAWRRPVIPRLEWHYAATEIWIGRLPRTPPEVDGNGQLEVNPPISNGR